MADPATDMRVKAGVTCFFAGGCDLDSRLKTGQKRVGDISLQVHELAGVGAIYPRHRAGAAERALPCRAQQAALFMVATAIVIPIKKLAFSSSRCSHFCTKKLPQEEPAGGASYTRVTYSPVRVSTRIVSPSLTKLGT